MSKYFKENGVFYEFEVKRDPYPLNPREEYENIGHMMIWKRGCSLGDENEYDTPYDFIYEMLEKYVEEEKVVEYAKKGAKSVHLEYYDDDECWYLYDYEDICITDSKTDTEMVSDIIYALSMLSIQDSLTLLGYADIVIMPLYIYEHSGMTISCADGYPYNDRWDGGQFGWIWTDRESVEKTCGGYLEDGNFIRLSDENWRTCAQQSLISEVKEYDQYLQGDCYGYTLSALKDGEFVEVDSVWGFYSDNWGDTLYEELAKEVTLSKLHDTLEQAV